jgi:hypothetical protein
VFAMVEPLDDAFPPLDDPVQAPVEIRSAP